MKPILKLKKQFETTMQAAKANHMEQKKLAFMCQEHYGDVSYNEVDADLIIDGLDYAIGNLTFEEFDQIMTEINCKEKVQE